MKAIQTDLNDQSHMPWLDGIRGFAAFWVLLSHVQQLVGMRQVPIMSWGGLAVDLFMILSGFLMAHHYQLRSAGEPWERWSTFLIFWIRRFFRIAPLYYFLLLVALFSGPLLLEYRQAIADIWRATSTPDVRYSDQSFTNFLLHISFVFGAIPDYAFRTPLPDWSIGLEMQFYLAFPFLMLAFLRFGTVRVGLILIATSIGLSVILRDFFHQFSMPSFLPIKLYVFIIGIWIATSRNYGEAKKNLLFAVGVVVLICIRERTLESIARIFLVIAMYYLMNHEGLKVSDRWHQLINQMRNILSRKVGRILGDTSYGVYLLHLLVLIPVAGIFTRYEWYLSMHEIGRFMVSLLMVVSIVYPLSWILHRTLETYGIQLGKIIIRRFISVDSRLSTQQV